MSSIQCRRLWTQGETIALFAIQLLQQLEKDLHILESFKDSISQYVAWWTRMNMAMSFQATSCEELTRLNNDLRKNKVAEKWQNLSKEFQNYTAKVVSTQT